MRKPVKNSYLDNADEEDELAIAPPPAKKRKKQKAPAKEPSEQPFDNAEIKKRKVKQEVKQKVKQELENEEAFMLPPPPPAPVQAAVKKSRTAEFEFRRGTPTGKIYELPEKPAAVKRKEAKVRKLGKDETYVALKKYFVPPSLLRLCTLIEHSSHPHAPEEYLEKLHRASTQRLFVLERVRSTDGCGCPKEVIRIAGSTGNIYNVTISNTPKCTCPASIYHGDYCKHVVYVMHKVLKVPAHLQYEETLSNQDLQVIFDTAPEMPTEKAEEQVNDGNRKPVEDDCPICCCDFAESDEEVVWCQVACGNNIHKACFDQWARQKSYGSVTCPFCRSVWLHENAPAKASVQVTQISMPTLRGTTGYYNVADQLGHL